MSPTAIQRIFLSGASRYERSLPFKNNLKTLVGGEGILLAEGQAHDKLRRAVSGGLKYDNLLAVENIFVKHAKELMERLGDGGGGDILSIVRFSTFDVILEASFGDDLIREQDAGEVAKLRDDYLQCLLQPRNMVLRRVLLQTVFYYLPAHWFGLMEKTKMHVRTVIAKYCHQYRQRPTQGLLRFMMDLETKYNLTDSQMLGNVLSFLAAGQATSSVAVCWTLYLLAQHPEWQQKLHDEVVQWDQSSLEQLDKLPLLHRIIKESLRLYPPVFFVSRTSTQPDTIHNHTLPAGSSIRIPILAIQRSKYYWGEDADEFRPDRWLTEDPEKKFLWCLFMFGSTGCVGQRFAMLEIKTFVAILVAGLTSFIKKEDKEPTCYGAFGTPRGMKLHFEKRH